MKNLRILAVSFDTTIQPYELQHFRGAVAQKVGLEHEWFHNHNNTTGSFHNRYPLIQYKLDTYRGQMRPMLLCLDNAIEEAQHLFSQSDWSLQINKTDHNLKIAHLHIDSCRLNVWDSVFSYRLHKWQALNPENFEKYNTLTNSIARTRFLEQLLRNQILSFAQGVDWNLNPDFELRINNPIKEDWMDYKNQQKVLAFTLNFETTLSLPDFIGIGKGASRGLGVVRKNRNLSFQD